MGCLLGLPDSSSNIWGVCLGCRTAAELYGVFAWAAGHQQYMGCLFRAAESGSNVGVFGWAAE
nr:hypothetical protein [Tanacetum cinerariifolium]